MAGYITLKSEFKPRTFDEMLRPLQIYGQAYNQVENALGEIDTKSGTIKNLINPQIDIKTSEAYNNFEKELQQASQELATSGLNANTRSKLVQLRSKYSKNIAPIEMAFKAKADDIAQYQEAKKKGDYISNYDPTTKSLDEYLVNPLKRNQGVYSELISKDIAETVAPIARGYVKSGILHPNRKEDKQFLEKGFTIEDVNNVLNGRSDKVTYGDMLKSAMDTVITKYGYVKDFEDPDAMNKVLRAVNKGVIASAILGREEKTEYNPIYLTGVKNQMEYNNAVRIQKMKDEAEAAKSSGELYTEIYATNRQDAKKQIAEKVLDKNGKFNRDNIDVEWDSKGRVKPKDSIKNTMASQYRGAQFNTGSKLDLKNTDYYKALAALGYNDTQIRNASKSDAEQALWNFVDKGSYANAAKFRVPYTKLNPTETKEKFSLSTTVRELADIDATTGELTFGKQLDASDIDALVKDNEYSTKFGHINGKPVIIKGEKTYVLSDVEGSNVEAINQEVENTRAAMQQQVQRMAEELSNTDPSDPLYPKLMKTYVNSNKQLGEHIQIGPSNKKKNK